jgi:lysozyme family protein
MGQLMSGIRVSIVPVASVVIGLLMYFSVAQVHDLFLETVGNLRGGIFLWTLFYLCVLAGWVFPVFCASRWILARYNVLAETTHDDALIPVAGWVRQRLPPILAVLCLAAVLIGQFAAALTIPETAFTDRDNVIEYLQKVASEANRSNFSSFSDLFAIFTTAPATEWPKIWANLAIYHTGTDLIVVGLYIALAIPFALWRARRWIARRQRRSSRIVGWLVFLIAIILTLNAYMVVAGAIQAGWQHLKTVDTHFSPTHLVVLPGVTMVLMWATWKVTRRSNQKLPIANANGFVFEWPFVVMLVLALVAISAGILVDPLVVTDYFNRANLLALALGVWVPVLTVLSLWSQRLRIPLILSGIVVLGSISLLFGDTYNVRFKNNVVMDSPDLDESLARWALANDCHLPPLPATAAPATLQRQPTGSKPCPAPVIVLAAGGASRASFYVTSVLGKLMDEVDDVGGQSFSNRIFAISGVSGGALAAVMYQAALADALKAKNARKGTEDAGKLAPPCQKGHEADPLWVGQGLMDADTPHTWKSCMQLLLAGDFLSPAISSLLFSDLLNIRFWGDRAETLERAWERRYERITGNPTLGESMVALRASLIEPGQDPRNWLPLLLINGTSVATGKRIVATELNLVASRPGRSCSDNETARTTDDCYRLFKDAYDLHDAKHPAGATAKLGSCDNCDIRLSTAATISARFPVVSPHGTIRNANGAIVDRVVDGGYFENNGALTAHDLAEALRDRGLKPFIIQITNEPKPERGDCDWAPEKLKLQPPAATPTFPLIRSPLAALLGTTTARGTLATVNLCRFVSPDEFLHFHVVSPNKGLLGQRNVSMSWWLSKNVQVFLDQQLYKSGGLNTRNENVAAFEWLGESLRRKNAGTTLHPIEGIATPSTRVEDIANEYRMLFAAAKPTPARQTEIDTEVSKILAGRHRYETVEKATGVPWYLVGIIHSRLVNDTFETHFHTSDPLTAHTVSEPRRRPETGTPPFTWEESAIDAMQYYGLTAQKDWSLPRHLYRLEMYFENHRSRMEFGLRSPYLWGGSNQYVSGTYLGRSPSFGVKVTDSATVILGAAVLLKGLAEKGAIKLPD